MTLEQINAFIAVTQYGNFSRAADSLYIAQPTLSHRITELENEIGVQLIVRSKGVRRVQLTDQGSAFIPMAEEWRRLWMTTSRLSHMGTSERIRITSTHTVSNFLLVDVIREFNSRNLNVQLHLMDSASIDAIRRIEHDEVDFAVVGNVTSSRFAAAQLLAREDIVFVSSVGSIYRDQVRAADLSINDEIYVHWGSPQKLWHEYWFGADFRPLLRLENVSLAEAFFSGENNRRWMLMAYSAAKTFEEKGIVHISELDEKVPARELYLVSRVPAKQPYYDYLREDIINVLSARDGIELIDRD